jgi:uncharacterized protein (TIGR03437 family)
VVWSSGTQFDITGSDATYVYSGSGSSNQPQGGCATATLSGSYTYDASGPSLSGTAETGSADVAGVLQFDGQGNVTNASYTITESGTTPLPITATGTYSVTSGCLASATLTDSTGKTNALNLVIMGNYGQNASLIEASSQYMFDGSAHSAFLNPSQSVGNAFNYAVGATPAGSAFLLYGLEFAAPNKSAAPTTTPFPTELLSTTLKVNGEAAPLYYVDSGQINAQMPWDIPGGTVASVVVTNGTAASNAVAVYVPATGTPGIALLPASFGNNRAAIVNQNGTDNTTTSPASVGDEVVAYFTGGGPVTPFGKLASGSPAPAGLSPVTGSYTITLGGINAAAIEYVGLTPGSIGLYQTNFTVPQIAKGTYPVVITIAGQASNTLGGPVPNPVMTVSN